MAEPDPLECESARLVLRRLGHADAEFLLRLLNDPDWLQQIGDRDVHDLDAARRFLDVGPLAMYARHGLGLLCVCRREDGVALGVCGLLRRPGLSEVDLGYALLPEWRGHGYAREAVQAVLDWAWASTALRRVAAYVRAENPRSIALLRALRFTCRGTVRLQPGSERLQLFACERPWRKASQRQADTV